MAIKNAINNTTSNLTIDSAVSTDSWMQHSINSVSKFRVGVDDTDDSFRISQGSALGTTDVFKCDSEGLITKPLQPAFNAEIASTISNITGDGTAYHIIYDTTRFDNNSDYNNVTSVFTASKDGLYKFDAFITQSTATDITDNLLSIVTSNQVFYSYVRPGRSRVSNYYGSDARNRTHMSVCCYMDQSDTAYVVVKASGGAKTVDLFATISSGFTGYLVC